MRFSVDKEVFEKLKGICFGIVVAKGINNKSKVKQVSDMLDENTENIRKKLVDVNLKEYPAISVYREAFIDLGINPNKYMSSIEALTKRILKGADLPKINNIVDLGNAISLKYVLPLGAHDMDKLQDDLEIRFSQDGDLFMPFGMNEQEKVEGGELVYVSGNTIKTRKWIWRQSDEGKIDEETSNVFFPIDGFMGKNNNEVLSARDELAKTIEQLFECEIKIGFIDENNTSIEL